MPMSVHTRADRWFERAHASLLGALPCRRGCDECCVGIFPITQLDVDLLREGMQAATADERDRIGRRAREQQQMLESAWPRLQQSPSVDGWTDHDMDQAARRFAELRCPALEDNGACALYAYRPVTCRTMGIPLHENGVIQGACHVQTMVPIVRLSPALRREEDVLAIMEADALAADRRSVGGEEIWLPYGFLDE